MPLLFAIPLIALGLAAGPLAAIGSLNTLFALAIPYTVKTWCAAAALLVLCCPGSGARAKKS